MKLQRRFGPLLAKETHVRLLTTVDLDLHPDLRNFRALFRPLGALGLGVATQKAPRLQRPLGSCGCGPCRRDSGRTSNFRSRSYRDRDRERERETEKRANAADFKGRRIKNGQTTCVFIFSILLNICIYIYIHIYLLRDKGKIIKLHRVGSPLYRLSRRFIMLIWNSMVV